MGTIWIRFSGMPTGLTLAATLHDKYTDEYYDAVAEDWGGTLGGADNKIALTALGGAYAGFYEGTATLPTDTATRKVTITCHNTAASDAPLGDYVMCIVRGEEVHEATLTSFIGNPADGTVFDKLAGIETKVDTVDTVVDAIKAKTDNLPSDPADASDIAAAFSTVNSTLTTIGNYIDTEVSAIKTVTDALTAAAAAKLATSAGQMIPFTVDSTLFTPTATQFECDDITEATENHYKDRVVIFTSGALAGQAKAITAYAKVGSNGRFTVGALTEAPGNNNTGIII